MKKSNINIIWIYIYYVYHRT